MTRAFGVFSNGGYKVEPYAVESIETSRGKVIYTAPKAKSTKVMAVETAAAMTAMMKTVIQRGTGAAANIGKPAAVKTGTTDDSKDATFFGYTPDVVTGVWVGNDDNTKNGNVTGGTVPALIWKDVMSVATAPYGSKDFDYPQVDLKSFKAGKAFIISQDAAQKTFASEENRNEEEAKKNDEDAGMDEMEEPVIKPTKTSSKASKKENTESAPPKVEVKPVKIETPKAEEPKLAPVPMAKPF